MKILLDTHIALWAVTKSNVLSRMARTMLLSSGNDIFYSLVSVGR